MGNATRAIVSTIGVILAISGIVHGFFEVLQGNAPTNGVIISAIGEANRMWIHGNEPAFTLIPNFLVTGTLAMIVSLAIIIWSVGFVHKKNGPLIFLLLFILLFLVGGGIGQIIFFTLAWAVATRINKPLTQWRKLLPERSRRRLSKLWIWSLIAGSLLLITALEIAVFGLVPGTNDPNLVSTIMVTSLGVALGFFLLTFVAGFAHDIERHNLLVGDVGTLG